MASPSPMASEGLWTATRAGGDRLPWHGYEHAVEIDLLIEHLEVDERVTQVGCIGGGAARKQRRAGDRPRVLDLHLFHSLKIQRRSANAAASNTSSMTMAPPPPPPVPVCGLTSTVRVADAGLPELSTTSYVTV